MTGDELRQLRGRLKLSQVALAERLGVTVTTVSRWECGQRAVMEPAARLVRLLVEMERRPGRTRKRS